MVWLLFNQSVTNVVVTASGVPLNTLPTELSTESVEKRWVIVLLRAHPNSADSRIGETLLQSVARDTPKDKKAEKSNAASAFAR